MLSLLVPEVGLSSFQPSVGVKEDEALCLTEKVLKTSKPASVL